MDDEPRSSVKRSYLALFFAAGVFSFAAQALLFREYLVLYQGSELAIGLFFGSWLLWVALGASLGSFVRRRWAGSVSAVPTISGLYAAAPFLQLAAFRSFRGIVGAGPGESLPLDALLGLTALANAPVSLGTGFLFTLASHAAGGGTGAAARNYVLECFGSFLGGAAVTLLVSQGASVLPIFVAASVLLLAAASALAWAGTKRLQLAFTSVLTVVALLVGASSTSLEEAAEQARWDGTLPDAELLAWTDTPYRHLAVGRRGPQYLLAVDGLFASSFPDEHSRANDAALIMNQRPRAANLLLIGDVQTGLLRHLLGYQPQRVTVLDPDAAGTAFLEPYLPAADRAALADPRVEIVAGDPRAELDRLPAGVYELTAVLVPDPDTAHLNRFFTREFYASLRECMTPDGVLATRVSSEENVLSDEVLSYGASLYHTLKQVFARVLASPGETQWLFAGAETASHTLDGRELAERYTAAPLDPRPFDAAELQGMWPADRIAWVRDRYEALAGDASLINTDARPIAFFHGLAYRAKALGSDLAPALGAIARGGAWLFLIPLLALFLARLHSATARPAPEKERRFNALALVTLFGGLGMSLEVMLMFAFQSHVGAIFEQVGLVAGLFMLGLALGGWFFVRLARRSQGEPWRLVFGVLLAALAATLALPELFAGLSSGSASAVLPVVSLGLGALTSAGFPLADAVLSAHGATPGEVAGPLESADHWGGAVAALLTGALFVPILGIGGARWVLVGAVVGVALLVARQRVAARDGAPGRVARWLERRARQPSFTLRRLSTVLLVGAGTLALMASLVDRRAEVSATNLSPEEVSILAQGAKHEKVVQPFLYYRLDPAAEPGGKARAAATSSAVVAPDVVGWGGPLTFAVSVGAAGKLEHIRVLESHETPAWVVGFGSWLEQLIGRDVLRPVELRTWRSTGARGPDSIDTLSGATVTSQAALEAVFRTGEALAGAEFGLQRSAEAAPRGGLDPDYGRPEVIFLALTFLAALVLVLRGQRWLGRGARWARLGLLATCVVGAGLAFNVQLSLADVWRAVTFDLPPTAAEPIFALFVGVLVVSALFGQLYCGYLCPFGAAQELLGLLSPFKSRVHHRLEDGARYVKFVLLAACVPLLLGGGAAALLAADPLGQGLGLRVVGGAWALLVLIGLASLVFFRPWCRYFCPVGALLALTNKLRLAGRLTPAKSFGRCDLGVDSRHDVDCLQCDRCLHGGTIGLADDQLPEPEAEVSP